MKRTIIIAVFTVAAAAVSFSQPGKPRAEEERAKEALMQVERDIGKANIDSDYAFFDRVEAEEFIFTDAGGGAANSVASEDRAGSPGSVATDQERNRIQIADLK